LYIFSTKMDICGIFPTSDHVLHTLLPSPPQKSKFSDWYRFFDNQNFSIDIGFSIVKSFWSMSIIVFLSMGTNNLVWSNRRH
jgi:hypothetical protein